MRQVRTVWFLVALVALSQFAFGPFAFAQRASAGPARVAGPRAPNAAALTGEDSRSASTEESGPAPRLTFDVGASGGSYNGQSYSEVNLGVNYYLSNYLTWRNAGFGRFQTGVENLFGLDTSLRAIVDADFGAAGFRAFAGPGFRFVTKGDPVPFVEGGAVLKLGSVAFGIGVKQLTYSWLGGSRENDTQTFFILAGGGSL